MDAKYLYCKNSTPNEPIIKIPIHRTTFNQNHIYKNCHEFSPKVTKREIQELFRHAVGGPITFGILDSTYYIDDVGYLLKLTKKDHQKS